MIALKRLDTQEQFNNLTKGQELIVHWKVGSEEHRKGNKISIYKMSTISDDNEVILKVRGNLYFSISMYLKGASSVEDVSIVVPENLLRVENQRLRKEIEDARKCFDQVYVNLKKIGNTSELVQCRIQSIESALHSPTVEQEATYMPDEIPWIVFDPLNPPALDISYLISDGRDIDFGYLVFDEDSDTKLRWFPNDSCQFGEDHITHYAIVNLPKENE